MTLLNLIAAAALTLALPLFAQAQHDHSKGYQSPTKATTTKAAKPALKPAEGASIKIISPTKGQMLNGDRVPIEYKLTKANAATMPMLMSMVNCWACSEAKKARSTASSPANTSWSYAS